MHFISQLAFFLLALAGGFAFGSSGGQNAQSIPPTYGQPQTPRVVAYVQLALKNGDLGSAIGIATQYRRLYGDTPEALEALSWVARGELAAGQTEQAVKDAQEIRRSAQTALAARRLDSEPHLPLALGAAYEIEAEALYQQQQRAKALELLQTGLAQWRGTSVAERLQKNINLMTLEGRQLPLLRASDWIGSRPASLSVSRGKVVLLFFWAHWCADCKAEAPIITKLANDLEPKGLVVTAPTRLYGYTADDDHTDPAQEKGFITKVFERYYKEIPNARVPLDESNFERFGVSTTPTIVVADKRGIVRLYHPGMLSEAALRAVIEPLLAGQAAKALP